MARNARKCNDCSDGESGLGNIVAYIYDGATTTTEHEKQKLLYPTMKKTRKKQNKQIIQKTKNKCLTVIYFQQLVGSTWKFRWVPLSGTFKWNQLHEVNEGKDMFTVLVPILRKYFLFRCAFLFLIITRKVEWLEAVTPDGSNPLLHPTAQHLGKPVRLKITAIKIDSIPFWGQAINKHVLEWVTCSSSNTSGRTLFFNCC